MAIGVGDVVQSKAGHDAKKYFVVIATLNESYVLIADGKTRGVDSPKQKNVRHLGLVESATDNQRSQIVDDKSIAFRIKKLSDIE